MILLIIALVLGVIKLSDLIASQVALLRPKGWLRKRMERWVPGVLDPPEDWSPIMLWVRRARGWGKPGGQRGGPLNLALGVFFDWIYRAPALAGIQAVLVFVAIGTVNTTSSGAVKEACVTSHPLGSPQSWLAPAAAGTAVFLSIATVALFLAGVALRLGEPTRIAGQVALPSKPLKRGESAPPLPAAAVVPLVAASLILSFASLYLALAAVEPGMFQASPCSLDPFSSVYFSTVVAATVGFGDIVPTKNPARLVVVAQMFFVVTFLAAFVAELLREPSTGLGSATQGKDASLPTPGGLKRK
jgi:hypothetical protein